MSSGTRFSYRCQCERRTSPGRRSALHASGEYDPDRWRSPFWQTWDLLLLWLAQLHGANGMRTIIADYARKDSTKFWLNTLLALSILFTLVLGTYVLLTFDANIS